MQYIVYYRVSTKEQGKSGLGLEAQKTAVKAFTNNCADCVIAEYTDIASGKNNARVELGKAIAHAKQAGVKLLIAKLDRLSRNAAFIFTLKDSQVDFVCCDMPDANTLTIGIFATMAQHERETISRRTKAALQAKKDQGFKLGKPENLTSSARNKGLETRRKNALTNEAWTKAGDYACMLREKDMSLAEIASTLNEKGFTTRRGKEYKPMTVSRLLKKC